MALNSAFRWFIRKRMMNIERVRSRPVELQRHIFNRLLFEGKLTEPLSSTASSLQIQHALEKLPTIGRVNVSDAPLIVGHPLSEKRARDGTSGPGGKAWRIEFNDHKYKGYKILNVG